MTTARDFVLSLRLKRVSVNAVSCLTGLNSPFTYRGNHGAFCGGGVGAGRPGGQSWVGGRSGVSDRRDRPARCARWAEPRGRDFPYD